MDVDTFDFLLMFTVLVGFSICILFIMKSYTEPKESPVTDEEPSSNTTEEGSSKSKLVESEEREDELWEMCQKNPELFDGGYYNDGYRFLIYKETGEYFLY